MNTMNATIAKIRNSTTFIVCVAVKIRIYRTNAYDKRQKTNPLNINAEGV